MSTVASLRTRTNMKRPSKKRSIARTALVGLLAAFVLWLIYKIALVRNFDSPMTLEQSCATDTTTTAQMDRFTPGAAPIPCEPWDIGTGVSGYSWTAPDARGVVLLQVGWSDYAQRYVEGANQLIPQLLQQGLSVYAFDMYGNGHSPGPRGFVNVQDAVNDNLVARSILQQQPLPIFLIGHSLGGLVTMASVVADDTHIAGTVLLAPALKYDTNMLTRAIVQVGGFIAPTLPAPVPALDLAALSRDQDAVTRMQNDPLLVTKPLGWLTAAGGAAVSNRITGSYDQVTSPILAIHGTDDVSTQPSGSSEMIGAVSSADATYLSITGGRHNLLDDADASLVASTLLDWINTKLPEPANLMG